MRTVIELFATGAAVLGLWLVVRYPRLGPRSLPSGVLTLAMALALLPLSELAIGTVAVTLGPAVALVCVMLPALTAVFWACGCFFRTLLGLVR